MRLRTRICAAGVLVLAIVASMPAMAKTHDKKVNHSEDALHVTISLSDRAVIQNYLKSSYRPHCPPGLAKKHNGCLPPGIAKKYAMGKPLPPGIASKHVPDDVLRRLHPLEGYQYVQVDSDVLLIAEATKKVADAVTLLSAVK